MHDLYQAPALIVTILLLPAFGHLFYRTRDIRNLLWFLAFGLVAVRSLLLVSSGNWTFVSGGISLWGAAIGESCLLVAAALFLSSLSPLSFRVGRFHVLYAIPFTAPLVVYAFLAYTAFRGVVPGGAMFWLFPGLGFCSILVGILWGRAKGSLPVWIGLLICAVFGALAVSFYFRNGLFWPLTLAESGTFFLAALLVFTFFRRLSPGVVISFIGFLLWSLPVLLLSPRAQGPVFHLLLLRLIVAAKVVTALGLILLALENELAVNRATGEREQRARRELEAYAGLEFPGHRLEDFDRQADHICETIAVNSQFPQVALLLLHNAGMYRVAGAAGLDGATIDALGALAARIPVGEFLRSGSSPAAAENSPAVCLDLRQWMRPGDDLERLQLTSVIAIPLQGRSAVEGALLLNGRRGGSLQGPLRHDDLAPLEMLTTRMQSVRNQTRMLEKLIDSERFAGLGQLAGNVTQQLNNPLTVILGYASLLEESPEIQPQERKGVAAILNAARSMRATIESLQRIVRTHSGQLTAVSILELLRDMEQLHRAELLQRSIDLRIFLPDDLPRAMCEPQQLRQAILHCLQFCMEALTDLQPERERIVTVEAASAGSNVRIIISHTGEGFPDPQRAFDSFVPAQAAAGDTSGLGLSLCATIVRENDGQAAAVNLHPTGAAIILELEAA